MAIPLSQQIAVGGYVLKQRLRGNDRYPLVLMLEPLFRCNLACPGCGKIDYPDDILNRRLSVQECIDAVEECGAPVVSIPGGEPLLHKEMGEIVAELVARKKYIYLCTNALLLEKKMHLFKPTKYLTFSIHLDGLEDEHDIAVDQEGVFERATRAIRKVKEAGFRVNVNSTIFNNAKAERVADFMDYVCDDLGVEGVTISPGYAYERASDQEHFLSRQTTKQLFRDVLKRRKKNWRFSQSTLFMDFLAGNQAYKCSPWSNPTRNVFGWQRPCYLLNEGYTETFAQLMEETRWQEYGVGNYEKCANCMVHSGFEGTAVVDTTKHPIKALKVWLKGVKTDGEMVPDISLDNQRPAEFIFESLVAKEMAVIHGQAEPAAAANNSEASDESAQRARGAA